MKKSTIANNKPIKVSLLRGEKKYFCTCGISKRQPFCDGSHKGTGLDPLLFEAEKDGDVYLCACKHTKTAPYCDGSQKIL